MRYPLEQVWHPRAGIANETASVIRKSPKSVEVEADGTLVYRHIYGGAFTQSLHLQSFPFDRQTFLIELVAVRCQPNEVRFVPDQTWIQNGFRQAAGMAPSITLPDWTIKRWETTPLTDPLAPGLEYSGYAFEFTATRDVAHYIWKVILPLILIVIMSFAVFWIEPVHASSQISISMTSMLTLIAFRFAVDSQLPRLP